MRSRFQAVALPSELGEFGDELEQVFRELGRTLGSEALTGECSPPLDVYETDDTVEIIVDLPGVEGSALRAVSKRDSVLIAGEKPPKRACRESSFHLVERGYGRFARVVRVGRACDFANASATLRDGELRISLPKIADRRGRSVPIAISTPTPHA